MAKVTTDLYGDVALLLYEPARDSKEILEWGTDLFISYDGTETTEKVRANARRKIYYKFYENLSRKIPGFIAQYGGLDATWAVPVWHEKQSVGTPTSGVYSLTCTTDVYDLRDDSLALLYDRSGTYQLLEISEVLASSITVTELIGTYTDAYLVPVRIGTVIDSVGRSSNGYSAYSEIGFDIIDVLDTTETVPDQYLSDDYYVDDLYKSQDYYQSKIKNNIEKIDYVIGNIEKRHLYDNNRIIKPFYNFFENQTDIYNFRSFLSRRAGRYRRYWEPTFEPDLTNVSTGTVTTTLQVASDGFLDWIKQREHIAVLTTAGVWMLREIAAASQASATVVELTLSSALSIPATTIDTISFLGLRRFAEDKVELSWSGKGVLMETTISTIEVSP
jgi:hypothetical protein